MYPVVDREERTNTRDPWTSFFFILYGFVMYLYVQQAVERGGDPRYLQALPHNFLACLTAATRQSSVVT